MTLVEEKGVSGRCCSSNISTSRVSGVEERLIVESEVMSGCNCDGTEGRGTPAIEIGLEDLDCETARFCCLMSHSWQTGCMDMMSPFPIRRKIRRHGRRCDVKKRHGVSRDR